MLIAKRRVSRKEVVVEEVTYRPELLYFGTLTPDPDDSRNLAMCGFLSNPSEDRKLQNKSFQKKMAVGMANGVDAYFGY